MDGLIGLDWGTTSLRACWFDADGATCAAREQAWGIRQLPAGGFAAALATITANWPSLPLIACGMVGSRQGWREVAYVELPADATQLAQAIECVPMTDGRGLHIVPGLHHRRGPDVIRGEETQLVGGLARHPELAAHSTWILPGTHSKWVSVRDQAIVDFGTLMTGELFALLCRHSILGIGTQDAVADPDAFARGVVTARDSGGAGVFSRLFSARSLMLDGELAGTSTADYLSGLLIGEEMRSAIASARYDCTRPIQLIGAPTLCQRYLDAARHFDIPMAEPVADAAAHGLMHLARLAGLGSDTPTKVSRC